MGRLVQQFDLYQSAKRTHVNVAAKRDDGRQTDVVSRSGKIEANGNRRKQQGNRYPRPEKAISRSLSNTQQSRILEPTTGHMHSPLERPDLRRYSQRCLKHGHAQHANVAEISRESGFFYFKCLRQNHETGMNQRHANIPNARNNLTNDRKWKCLFQSTPSCLERAPS